MATTVEEFLDTKAGGFLAGFFGTIIVVSTIYYTGPFLLRAAISRGPKIIAKKFAEGVVSDYAIGRVPILQLERPLLSATTIGTSIWTVLLWGFGGTDSLVNTAKHLAGYGASGSGWPDEVSVAGESSFDPVLRIKSQSGLIRIHGFNGAMVDP